MKNHKIEFDNTNVKISCDDLELNFNIDKDNKLLMNFNSKESIEYFHEFIVTLQEYYKDELSNVITINKLYNFTEKYFMGM